MNNVTLDPSTVVKQRQGKRPWRWLKVSGLGLLAIIIFLPIVGMIYQAAGAANDARRYPPPGQLIDIGGYRLPIYAP
jgi:hypothetical protein